MPSNHIRSAVDNVMIRSCLCTIPPDATITDAAEKMCGQGSMTLVVFDGTPLGAVTAEHILQALADSQNPETTMVADIMTAAPISAVNIGAALDQVVDAMLKHHVQAVAVRDGEKLAGLVTLPSILPSLAIRTRQVPPVEAK